MTPQELRAQDAAHVWHPFRYPPAEPPVIPVVRAEGAWLYLAGSGRLLDGVSSWWVTTHGHCHPHIAQAVAQQAASLDQALFANTTHPQAARLAQRIAHKLPGELNRVFFSDNGSTAVEVALKAVLQTWRMRGTPRTKFLALEHAYHGDTFGAMSVSGRSPFNAAFAPLLFEVERLPFPGTDPTATLAALQQAAPNAAGLILEPLLLGAGGMQMYSPEVFKELLQAAKTLGLYVVVDEVLTGFGRTGTLFAIEHAATAPDIVCLSKGLTGGTLPLGLTVVSEELYTGFNQADPATIFYHGHSFTANPIACSAANASLDLFEQPSTWAAIERIGEQHRNALPRFANMTGVTRARSTGTVLAFEFKSAQYSSAASAKRALMEACLAEGLYIRPLGNTVYLMPPYCITESELETAYTTLLAALVKCA